MRTADRLVVYQTPPFAQSRFSGRVRRTLSSNFRTHEDFRHVEEWRDLFARFGQADMLHFTTSTRDLEAGRFFLLLNLGAYVNLSPLYPKSITGYSIYSAFSPKEWKALRDLKGRILLYLINEVLFASPDYIRIMHEEMDRWHIDPSNVVIVNNNLLSDRSYEAACSRLGYDRRAVVLPYAGLYWLFAARRRNLTPGVRDPRIESAYSTVGGRERPYKFVSFNGRIRAHRVCVVLFLIARGLEASGRTSLLWSMPGKQMTVADLEPMLDRMPFVEELRPQLPGLVSRLPLVLDFEPRGVLPPMQATPDAALYDDSYFSILTDTLFMDDDMLFLTEKPFKSILNLHPFVYVGNPGALREFRRLGYETFSPCIDESYDGISDHTARMAAVLHEIERLVNLPKPRLHEMYCELWPRLEHNYRLLTHGAAERFPRDLQGKIGTPLGLDLFPGS